MTFNQSRMTFKEIKGNKARYLEEYNLVSEFTQSKCDWDVLMSIAEDFQSRRDRYVLKAQEYLSEISNFKHIHSYRHRIKEIDSLIKKIIIKTIEKGEQITIDNYRTEITDLVGIRVLYVFKSDYYPVHEQIWNRFGHQTAQNIHIKLRQGDDKAIYEKILKYDPMIEEDSVYRSIHYTIYINENDTRDARLEIQTRTIFEEGWSEINHKLVYKNKGVADYLILHEASRILSALVGNCDTLGELMKSIHNEYIRRNEQAKNTPEIEVKTDAIMQDVLKKFLLKY